MNKRGIGRDAAIALLAANGFRYTDRARNYELEFALQDLPGAFRCDWWINEICPFNGPYSRWGMETGRYDPTTGKVC